MAFEEFNLPWISMYQKVALKGTLLLKSETTMMAFEHFNSWWISVNRYMFYKVILVPASVSTIITSERSDLRQILMYLHMFIKIINEFGFIGALVTFKNLNLCLIFMKWNHMILNTMLPFAFETAFIAFEQPERTIFTFVCRQMSAKYFLSCALEITFFTFPHWTWLLMPQYIIPTISSRLAWSIETEIQLLNLALDTGIETLLIIIWILLSDTLKTT